MDNQALEQSKATLAAKVEVAKLLKNKEVDDRFRTKEMIQQRLDAYRKLYGTWSKYILNLMRDLHKDVIQTSQERMAAQRLIANWEMQERQFLVENENFLQDVGEAIQEDFLLQEFNILPEDRREEIFAEFKRRRGEVFRWLAVEIRAAHSGTKKDDNGSG